MEQSPSDLPPVMQIAEHVIAEDASMLRALANDNYKNLHQRMNEVRKEVSFIRKVLKKGMNYAVVSHDEVTAKLRPSLIENGILYYPQNMTFRQDGNRTECQFDVRFANADYPDDCIDVPTLGYGIDNQDKGPGKAISYGVKMALLKTFNLESGEGEDPDFDQESEHVPAKKNAGSNAVAQALAIVDAPAKTGAHIDLLSEAFKRALTLITTVEELEDFYEKTKFIFEMEAYAPSKGAAIQYFKTRKTELSGIL